MPDALDPQALAGYRRVPGYGTFSFFNPETGEHRSSRRYYNPAYTMSDPRREISEYQYRQLQSQAGQDQRYNQIARREFRSQQERQRQADARRLAREQGISYARARDLQLQTRIYTYETQGLPSFDPMAQAVRRPGGPLSDALEGLGLRPPNAPWAVGESGSTEYLPSLGNSPAGAMAGWRSQYGGVEVA